MHDFRQRAPWSVPPAVYYAECLSLVEEAERLGYDAVWLCEHHGTADGFLPSPLVVAGAIAARTARIRIGTAVLLLPLHHPLRVAEDAAVVHALSGGRLILAVGQGYAPEEFAAFGVDRRHRPSRLEEGVAIIRQAWRDGRTGFSGRRFDLPDLPFEPRPPAGAPIWFGAVGERAVDRAVRQADGLLVYVSEPADAADRYAVLAEALARHDRDPATFPFALTTLVHVADDADLAWREAAAGLSYLESALRAAGGEGPALRAEDMDRDRYLVGTPAEVADKLVALHRAAPFDHLAFWGRLPGLPAARAAEAAGLFATEVAPQVTAAVAGGQAQTSSGSWIVSPSRKGPRSSGSRRG
jgi:alkanesulfonate monooxygenase SsuD/methylene tetrahydromethanopterin reductase-like flavin-dependent oxidoreductase (luciferase family)